MPGAPTTAVVRPRGWIPAAPEQPLFQPPIENVRIFYAASSTSTPVDIYTVPSKQKAIIDWLTFSYTGSDVGPETIIFYVQTPAGTSIQIGSAAIGAGDTVRAIASSDILHLESGYGLRYSVTGGAQIDCVCAGIEMRLPG